MKNTTCTTTDALRASFTTKHTGKMNGLWSVSTSPTLNPHCLERRKNGATVCAHCFAFRQLGRYKSQGEKLIRNTALWTKTLYSPSYMPEIKSDLFRLEAFGDIINTTQVLNYFALCIRNPRVKFALWTKNPQIVWQALETNGYKKPQNLVIVYSSPALNRPADNMLKLYTMPNGRGMIDKVFTVYTADAIERDGVRINCGARSCNSCRRCYSKRTGAFVNEKIK